MRLGIFFDFFLVILVIFVEIFHLKLIFEPSFWNSFQRVCMGRS